MGLASNIGVHPTAHVNALSSAPPRRAARPRLLHAFHGRPRLRPRFRRRSLRQIAASCARKMGEIVTASALLRHGPRPRWTGSKWPTKPSFMAQETCLDPSNSLRNAFQMLKISYFYGKINNAFVARAVRLFLDADDGIVSVHEFSHGGLPGSWGTRRQRVGAADG